MQENGLGALSIMLVDTVCRRELLLAEPGLKTLLALCVDQPGYEGEWAARRRIDSAKALCLVLQRDPELRLSLIQSGAAAGLICGLHVEVEHLQSFYPPFHALCSSAIPSCACLSSNQRTHAPV